MSVTYTVEITNPIMTGDSAGFIDAKRLEYYGAANITLSQSMDKKRGNLRYVSIMSAIMSLSNVRVLDVLTTDATAILEGSKFSTTLLFNSEAAVYLVRNGVEFKGEAAVSQIIAENICVDDSKVCDFFKPDAIALTQELSFGKLALDIDAAKLLITVNRI